MRAQQPSVDGSGRASTVPVAVSACAARRARARASPPAAPPPGWSTSVDLVLTNGKRMVKALPMALPGASQGCRTLGYDRGGDKAPQTRSNGCREIVFGQDAPLWSEPFNRSRTVMAAVRVAHPPAPRRLPRELSYHRPTTPIDRTGHPPALVWHDHVATRRPKAHNCARTEIKRKYWTVYVLHVPRFEPQVGLDASYCRAVCVVQGVPIGLM